MAPERGSQTGEEKEPRPSSKVPRPPGLPASPSTLSVPWSRLHSRPYVSL